MIVTENLPAIAAQHAAGKLTARERIELLLDADSCVEIDRLVEHGCTDFGMAGTGIAGDGVCTAHGTINGRPVFVFAKDMTVFHGTLSAAHARKIAKVQELALRSRAPLIGLFDSDGARVQEGHAALAGYGELYRRSAAASGVVPQLSLILGPCPGGEALLPALGDFTFMVDGTSAMFVNDPEVIASITGETLTAQALGGAAAHTARSALADARFDNDITALQQARRLIDFLPAHNRAGVPPWPCLDSSQRAEPALDTLVPQDAGKPYDMRELVQKLVDDGDFFELQAEFAANIITGFGRIDGRSIGIVANQPNALAGVIDADATRKAARFVRFCDAFNIAVVSLVDVPGFLPTAAQEHGGFARHAAQLVIAYAQATVPLVTVITRHAFGAAGLVMGSPHIGADICLAWPSAQIGLVPPQAADTLLSSASDAATYREQVLSPATPARLAHIDAIVVPSQTRRHVAQALAMLANKTCEQAPRKHATVPL